MIQMPLWVLGLIVVLLSCGIGSLFGRGDRNEPPAIEKKKKAVVIGIHGFYPVKFTRGLLGESTHTAQEITQRAAKQLHRWSEFNDVPLDIETIALEGYGKVLERASYALQLLENWMDSISGCDYLIIASHSQGVPIAINVTSRLINAGYLANVEKIGLINVSGICLGPFSGLDSKLPIKGFSNFEKEILLEIFDFQDPESELSCELRRHLRVLVNRNVKLTFVGSMNDQFVPLYSSLNVVMKHPNVFRCVYIDGDSDQPDFLINLMNLILITKNLCHEDHELLVELSSFLAGEINTAGHSRVLQEENVYLEGLKNTLETTQLIFEQPIKETKINVKEFNMNQYHLPWCLRGFLQELSELKHVDEEEQFSVLQKQFEQWNPVTKEQKELKFCMAVLGTMKREDVIII
ncbi:unnamed protein product [Ambrosiozyma monospora]|uniref:Unnamed protein product n=1 Tax=Ambrosiozyma monospora TaxID=43982 RepID=A0A9W6Z5P4_AMBMO|nr:unnamed protein product [Ambrosiozyma monospora]